MSEVQFQLRRTGWDVAIGALLVIGGLVILGDAALATTVSILLIGWVLLIVGVLGLAASLFRIGKGGFWSAALSGGLLTVLGLFFLNNTEVAAVTLTLMAGAVFLTGGIVRLVAAGGQPEYRVALIFSGIVSLALGLIVLFNLFEASFVLLGVLLGVEMLADGVAMIAIGRVRVVPEVTAGTHRVTT